MQLLDGTSALLFDKTETKLHRFLVKNGCWEIIQSKGPYFYIKSSFNDMTLSTSFYYPDVHISSNVKMNVGHGWSTFTGLWEIESTEDNNNVRLKFSV